ncbi:hypothetical protein SSP35_09_01340 [Streptomyces sp. NBRC 110611]|nr:hypothetical protein SSP35_09_01340 [Streptomyces sp. NBRC 110611]
MLAGCHSGAEGVRPEGSASSTTASKGTAGASAAPGPAATPSPAPTAASGATKADVVQLMRDDPKVGADVKKSLYKPCAADEYAVDVTYASLTGNEAPDVIVNVMTCADSVGIGSYVYRRSSAARDGYDNVYANEQPSVHAGISKGELEISTQTYAPSDKVCCPSGENVILYRWAKDHFAEHEQYHTDYSKTTVAGGTPDGDGAVSEG